MTFRNPFARRRADTEGSSPDAPVSQTGSTTPPTTTQSTPQRTGVSMIEINFSTSLPYNDKQVERTRIAKDIRAIDAIIAASVPSFRLPASLARIRETLNERTQDLSGSNSISRYVYSFAINTPQRPNIISDHIFHDDVRDHILDLQANAIAYRTGGVTPNQGQSIETMVNNIYNQLVTIFERVRDLIADLPGVVAPDVELRAQAQESYIIRGLRILGSALQLDIPSPSITSLVEDFIDDLENVYDRAINELENNVPAYVLDTMEMWRTIRGEQNFDVQEANYQAEKLVVQLAELITNKPVKSLSAMSRLAFRPLFELVFEGRFTELRQVIKMYDHLHDSLQVRSNFHADIDKYYGDLAMADANVDPGSEEYEAGVRARILHLQANQGDLDEPVTPGGARFLHSNWPFYRIAVAYPAGLILPGNEAADNAVPILKGLTLDMKVIHDHATDCKLGRQSRLPQDVLELVNNRWSPNIGAVSAISYDTGAVANIPQAVSADVKSVFDWFASFLNYKLDVEIDHRDPSRPGPGPA